MSSLFEIYSSRFYKTLIILTRINDGKVHQITIISNKYTDFNTYLSLSRYEVDCRGGGGISVEETVVTEQEQDNEQESDQHHWK